MVNSIVIVSETSFDVLLSCDEQISPQKIKDVVKCMHFRASKGDSVFKGDYTLSGDGQVKNISFSCILGNIRHLLLILASIAYR